MTAVVTIFVCLLFTRDMNTDKGTKILEIRVFKMHCTRERKGKLKLNNIHFEAKRTKLSRKNFIRRWLEQ